MSTLIRTPITIKAAEIVVRVIGWQTVSDERRRLLTTASNLLAYLDTVRRARNHIRTEE